MARNAVVSLIIKGRDQTKAAVKGAQTRLKGLGNAIRGINKAMLALAATAAVAIGKRLVEAFGRQERAIIRVNSALMNTGQFSEEASQKIQKAAADLQKITTAGDEAILEGTAAIADLATDLSPDDLIRAQQAMIGIADTFFDGNVRQAAILMGKSLGSANNALMRYGVEIDTTASQQEKLNQIMEVAAPLFKTSERAATDVLGTMAQMSNAAGDVEESLGEVIVRSLNLRDAQGGMTNVLAQADQAIKDNMQTWVNWGRGFVAVFRTLVHALKGVRNPIRAVVAIFKGMYFAIRTTIETISADVVESFNNVIRGVNWVREKMGKDPLALIESTNRAEEFREKGRAAFRDLAQASADQREHAKGYLDIWRGITDEIETANSATIRQSNLTSNLAGSGSGAGTPFTVSGEATAARPNASPLNRPLSGIPSTLTAQTDAPTGDGTISLGRSISEVFAQAFGAGQQLDALIVDMTTNTLEAFGTAVSDAFKAWVDGSVSAGEAFKNAMLGALATVAGGFGRFFLAKATAELGKAIGGNPAGFAAAAKYTAAATAMFALSGALQGVASASGGGSASSAAQETEDVSRTSGTTDIYIDGDYVLDPNNPTSVDRFRRMMEDLSGRRVVVHAGDS